MRDFSLWLTGGVLLALGAGCTPPALETPPQTTTLNGTVYGRAFDTATAAFAEDQVGVNRAVVVRVARRADTCAASNDPSDNLDPSILLSITPPEKGTFAIGTGASDRYASATLLTFTDPPDGGFSPDAGARPVVVNATGGQVEITEYEPGVDGKLNANVVLQFGSEGYVGQVGAYGCDRVK
jgi:hypothetical protein